MPIPTDGVLTSISDSPILYDMDDTRRPSPLAVTRTPAGWAITHRQTGFVVLASDVLKTRVMARTAARLLTAGMNWTAPSASAIAALPTLRNAVIRTVSARRREQLARVHTVPTPVLGQVAA